VYIKYLLATPPKNGSRPSERRNSRLKTTTRRSINPLHKFYAVKFSCIHGGRKYKATGKVRKTPYVLFLSEKKWSLYVLLGKSRHLRPTFLCNERVLQHDTIFYVQSSAVRGLRSWLVLKEKCGANVWNLNSCIGLYECHVIEPFCAAGSNKRNDRGALHCSKVLCIYIERTWRSFRLQV